MEDARLTGASSLIECPHPMQGFQPSVWGDYFVENKPMSPSELHEQTANHLATIVHSYMKEYNCTEEETCQKLIEMVENEWKTLNQELLLLTNLPLTLVRPIINLTRVMEIFYKEKDTFTNPFDTMKNDISLVMIEPLFPNGAIPK
ncbi:hypothetical protein HPP92_023513 [Vanilla planifolia]|uniref:Terpene synthase metal-binding domain-containing protein n=1 Tax=Vanilla planifolia TaxID=51239 RepID=A0A835UC33_VANPL|nr:hypothetical protein HPP92_023513 [Vanilla planifolia]